MSLRWRSTWLVASSISSTWPFSSYTSMQSTLTMTKIMIKSSRFSSSSVSSTRCGTTSLSFTNKEQRVTSKTYKTIQINYTFGAVSWTCYLRTFQPCLLALMGRSCSETKSLWQSSCSCRSSSPSSTSESSNGWVTLLPWSTQLSLTLKFSDSFLPSLFSYFRWCLPFLELETKTFLGNSRKNMKLLLKKMV